MRRFTFDKLKDFNLFSFMYRRLTLNEKVYLTEVKDKKYDEETFVLN